MGKKCIAVSSDGKYLTPRRNNGKLYESRSGWSADIEDAKIFQTPAAAKNSADANGQQEYEVKPVRIIIDA